MNILHWYHVYAEGAWAGPITEHINALAESGLGYELDEFIVTLVGQKHDRDMARYSFERKCEKAGIPAPSWSHFTEGFEQTSLLGLQRMVNGTSREQAVLYAHAKGAFHEVAGRNAAWRKGMTEKLVGGWRECVDNLGEFQTVGCHWITPEEYHDPDHEPPRFIYSPFYGGNFWWARASYLRTLPPVPADTRYDAETWIGLGNPQACDLSPGWPRY